MKQTGKQVLLIIAVVLAGLCVVACGDDHETTPEEPVVEEPVEEKPTEEKPAEENLSLVTAGMADLGLSVKWAASNVGADKPEAYGDYLDWSSANKSVQKLSGGQRLPSEAEMNELITGSTWKWATLEGVNGYYVTGSSGKTIFLPAAGFYNGDEASGVGEYGRYWSSTLYADDASMANTLRFVPDNDEYEGYTDKIYVGQRNQRYRHTIRTVTP